MGEFAVVEVADVELDPVGPVAVEFSVDEFVAVGLAALNVVVVEFVGVGLAGGLAVGADFGLEANAFTKFAINVAADGDELGALGGGVVIFSCDDIVEVGAAVFADDELDVVEVGAVEPVLIVVLVVAGPPWAMAAAFARARESAKYAWSDLADEA